MRRAALILSRLAMAALTSLVLAAQAQDSESVTAARRAAQAWLAEVDAGRYAESWDLASSAFQAGVTKAQWIAGVSPIRNGIGAVTSRTLRSATFTHTLPGAPDGDYVIIEYDTRFEKKTQSIETVTPMRDKDGRWKVSGYFIN